MLEGKQVIVIFDDGTSRCNKREGNCTTDDKFWIVINNKDYIPKDKIVRVEVTGDSQ